MGWLSSVQDYLMGVAKKQHAANTAAKKNTTPSKTTTNLANRATANLKNNTAGSKYTATYNAAKQSGMSTVASQAVAMANQGKKPPTVASQTSPISTKNQSVALPSLSNNTSSSNKNTGGSSSGSGSSGGGGGTPSSGGSSSSSNTTVTAPVVVEPAKIDWQNKSIDEMAAILGIENYKYDDILNLYNNATGKKFDEYDTQATRNRDNNLRDLSANYDTYLNQMREDRANAAANGVTKGTQAAIQLASMVNNAGVVSEGQQTYNDLLYDLMQERGTALEENAVTAYQDRQAIEQYLGTLRGTYEANSVNELAAKLAANSQVQAAQLQANATTKAAGINADATKYAANSSAAASKYSANASDNFVYNLYKQQYGNSATNKYLNDLNSSNRTNALLAQYQMSSK